MHHKKLMIILVIVSTLTIVSAFSAFFVYPFFTSTIKIVSVESEGREVTCYLQWQGIDQTTIKFVALADLGRTNYQYSEVVNNGEIFEVPLIANYSWVEISYLGKTFSMHSDGKNATLYQIH
jgi:capsular polysaccharide biosynthesis protein